MSIPRDLDEAAHIDGASPVRILAQVIVPLMKPALTTLAILAFLGHWNDFFGPYIYLNKSEMYTAAVGLRWFQVMPMESTEPKDHLLMAAAVGDDHSRADPLHLCPALLCAGRGDVGPQIVTALAGPCP